MRGVGQEQLGRGLQRARRQSAVRACKTRLHSLHLCRKTYPGVIQYRCGLSDFALAVAMTTHVLLFTSWVRKQLGAGGPPPPWLRESLGTKAGTPPQFGANGTCPVLPQGRNATANNFWMRISRPWWWKEHLGKLMGIQSARGLTPGNPDKLDLVVLPPGQLSSS